MSIYQDEPKFLTDEKLEKIIDMYKDNAPHRIFM